MTYLLDTNLLLLLVIGMTDPKYIEKHERVRHIYDVEKFNRLFAFIATGNAIVCTPNILTETSNLLSQIGDPIRSEIMGQLAALIATSDERYVESRTAALAPSFIRLGLTDSAVLSLPKENMTVLTVDFDLYKQCYDAGFKVENLTSYLQE